MNLEKEAKLINKIAPLIALIVVGFIILCIWYYRYYTEKQKIKFLEQYISEDAAIYLLKYSREYNHNWLKSFAVLMSESDGKRTACHPRTRCKGYMQLAPVTSGHLRSVLKRTIKDTDIYAAEYNIAGGLLFLKTIMENFTDDFLVAVEIYNVGYTAYRDQKKRNGRHIKKWAIKYTHYKCQWKKF